MSIDKQIPTVQKAIKEDGLFTIPWLNFFRSLTAIIATFITKSVTISNTVSPYTPANDVKIIFTDTTLGAITINIPAWVNGKNWIIKNIGTGGNDVTLIPNGTDTIEEDTIYDAESFQIERTSAGEWKVT